MPTKAARKRRVSLDARPAGNGARGIRILHPFPSLLVATLTVVLAVIADPDADRFLYLQLGLGMLLFQLAIGITNDIADIDVDRASKPWKPLVSGTLSRQTAVLLAAACAGAGLLLTASLPIGAWMIGAGGLFCGLAYDVSFKRTALSWLPYAVALPLIPAWVYVSLDAWDALLWWVFPLGVTLGLALHLANQSPDLDGDRKAGVVGAAHRIGGRRSVALAIALFGVVASLVVVVLLFESPGRALLAAINCALVVMLAPRAQLFFGRDGLFGLLSAASAILAVVFLSAV